MSTQSKSARDFLTHLASDRPAYPAEGPAVIRHLMFRLRKDENPRLKATKAERDREWVSFCNRLSTFINGAMSRLGVPGAVTLVRGPAQAGGGQSSINTSVLIDLSPGSGAANVPMCRIRMRLDVHVEYYAITLLADQFKDTDPHLIARNVTALNTGANAASELLTALLDTIWTQMGQPFGYVFEDARSLPGDQVADLRGIVLIAPDPPASLDPVHSSGMSPGVRRFWDERQNVVAALLGGAPPAAGVPAVVESESVACTFSDGRALYMAPLVAWGNEPRPVKYVLVADGGMSANSLGRLLRRMNVLFELRHAALMDYDLGEAGNDLKAASRELRMIGAALDEEIGRDGDNPAPRHSEAEARNLNTKVARLLDINKRLTALNTHADGGLVFRIEQSRLYADEFVSRLQDLRVDRIEGYPPYDAFARRRVIHLFARIQQIGRRYTALGRRVDRWAFLIEADSATKFHEDIRELQRTTKNLSENGEKFASIFFVYYAGYIAKEFLAGSGAGHEAKTAFTSVWLAILVLSVVDAAAYDGRLARWTYRAIGFVGLAVWAVLLRFGRFPGRGSILKWFDNLVGPLHRSFGDWLREWLRRRDASGKRPAVENANDRAGMGDDSARPRTPSAESVPDRQP